MESLVLLCIWPILSLIFMTSIVAATDTISANQTIKDGEKIVSASGIFEVGFFRPRGSTSNRRYLGIWYAFSNETVVWVANREVPLNDTSGVLQFEGQGMLVIRDSSNFSVWSSTNSSKQGQNPIAQILDTGNLVVREADDTNEENYLWQSFDHLCNTMLPSVKYGKNLVTGIDNYLVSWKSDSDPSLGDTINRIDTNGYPQIFMSVGETIVFRSGPWNGLSFGGVNNLKPNPIFSYQLIYNDKEIDYRYDLIDKSIISRFVISDPGVVQRFNWNTSTKMWSLYLSLHIDKCDIFGTCGAFGSCNLNNSPLCHCLNGFVPKFPHEWESGNWSGGCTRKNKLVCEAGQTFQRIDGVKLPDTRTSWFNRTMNLLECEKECLNNCSCTAYSTLDISSGTGCLLWSGELLDIREYSGNGQTFYLRLPSTDSDQTNTSGSSFDKKLIGAIVIPVLITALVLVVLLFFIRNKRRRKQGIIRTMHNNDFDKEKAEEDLELPVFDLSAIAKATNDFSNNNKLGEGGFGPVYKGTLNDGQEIAVKRLSKSSGQGMSEFKNEVVLIAKLQHRNLVKLLGCCIEEEEKMLIYEFMPNKSLDYFIFDQSGRKLLDWSKRMVIIEGIARGLLYLHQDSRLRVIHRDLKASNVLLDADMNPKISDFGMARMFRGDQYMANTKNVVGTYGYMSPEYAIDGVFSTKSDVFSFGVLVLEIVSGKRNRAFNHPDHSHNLLGHAWKLMMDKRPLELLDSAMDDSLIEFEIIRCIHVGLLCVQQRPEDRPNISSVVLMLGSENMLPQPKQPGFFTERNMPDSECSSSNVDSVSKNEITITLLEAR